MASNPLKLAKASQCCSTCLIARDALVMLEADGSCKLCKGEDPASNMTAEEAAYFNSDERKRNLNGDDWVLEVLRNSR